MALLSGVACRITLMVITRYVKPHDVAQINSLYKGAGLETPILSDTTIVAVEGDNILAIFSSRIEAHVEWICQPNLKGHRAGLRVFLAGENMLKAQGHERYEVGILSKRTEMRSIAEKVGFTTWGQLLYEKKLDEVVR